MHTGRPVERLRTLDAFEPLVDIGLPRARHGKPRRVDAQDEPVLCSTSILSMVNYGAGRVACTAFGCRRRTL
jgi:hypothetical protein